MAAGPEGMFGEAQPMPPAAPEPDRRSARRVIGWVVGFLLLIGVKVLDVANETYKDPGTVAGAFIAAIGLSLLVALGLRFAVVKVSRPGRPIWSPWVPAIAAGIALVSLVIGAPREVRERREYEEGKVLQACEREGPFRFATLQPGLRYEEIPAAQLEQAREELPFSPEFRQSVEGRLIAANRSPVAVVFVIPVGVGREGRKGYFKGFTERAAEVGARPREIQLGSARGTVVTPSKGPNQGQLLFTSLVGCRAVVAVAPDENTLRMAITPVVGG